MEKLNVSLGEEESRKLKRLAQSQHVSQSEIVRRALRAYEPAALRTFSMTGSGTGDGTSIADVPEEELLWGFGE